MAEQCEWKEEIQPDGDSLWETSCGQTFCFNGGTPTDNKMKYCCYCGKELKETLEVADEG